MATDGQADRLSSLPDDLLYHVLSFLPAHEVVPTCVLARRWRHLWRFAPALRITGVKGCNNAEWFVNFVHSLLLLRDPRTQLDSFEIDLDDGDFDFKEFLPANEEHVNRWFRHAVMCGPRVLALRTTDGIYMYEDDYQPMMLSNVPLISQHLTRLELEMVDVYSSTLDLSGCPALVHLKIDDSDIDGNITSPSLQHLSINLSYFRTGPFRTRIRTPNLVSLELIDVMRRAPVLVENMPLLVSASVILSSHCVDSCSKNDCGDCNDLQCYGCHSSERGADDRRGESVLFEGLAEVQQLELSVDPKVFIVNRDFKLSPTFSKLKTLLLSKWCPGIAGDLNILSCFLKHSPIMEKLTLHLSEVPKVPVETQRSYTPPDQPLECSHLKIVEIRCDEVDERAQRFLIS
ncbi:F-box/LRR-repeat protein At3g26922-like [Aegilops tauschii subsp. strangulata]